MDMGSLWNNFKGLFTGEPSVPYYGEGVGAESVYDWQAAQIPEPEPFDYEPYTIAKPGFLGSLWDGFRSTTKGIYEEVKEIAPDVMSVYKTIQEIKKPVDDTALVIRETPRAEIPRQDFVVTTPYQRSTSGTQPASGSIPPKDKAGLPMPLIVIGAALVFFMLKKR